VRALRVPTGTGRTGAVREYPARPHFLARAGDDGSCGGVLVLPAAVRMAHDELDGHGPARRVSHVRPGRREGSVWRHVHEGAWIAGRTQLAAVHQGDGRAAGDEDREVERRADPERADAGARRRLELGWDRSARREGRGALRWG